MSTPCPVLCFVVTIRMNERTTVVDSLRLVNDLNLLLDRNGLTATSQGEEYLIRRDGSQATENDRSLIRDWATGWVAVAAVDVGDIVDVGHGD